VFDFKHHLNQLASVGCSVSRKLGNFDESRRDTRRNAKKGRRARREVAMASLLVRQRTSAKREGEGCLRVTAGWRAMAE